MTQIEKIIEDTIRNFAKNHRIADTDEDKRVTDDCCREFIQLCIPVCVIAWDFDKYWKKYEEMKDDTRNL